MRSSQAAGDRVVGFPALLALGVNGIVGVGIFFAPASVAAEVPGATGVLVYLGTALLLLPVAAAYAALGGRFPEDGGPYVWAREAFGPRFAFHVGWIAFTSAVFSMAAVVSGLAHHASPLFGIQAGAGERTFAVGSVVVLAGVASAGLRPSAVAWTTVTFLKLVPLLALVVLGVLAASAIPRAAAPAPPSHDVERAALVVIFACQGFEIVPLLAGSVRRPERSVPLATVLSLLFAVALYATLHALAVRAVPGLGASKAPLVDAARVYGGSAAAGVVALGANVSALGIAFGMINTTPRYLSTLAGPSGLRPWVGALDENLVPRPALLITTVLVVILVSVAHQVTELFVLSSLAVLAQYGVALAALAVLGLRRSRGLGLRHVVAVPLAGVGILLAARGANPGELGVLAVVLALGEILRRAAQARV